LPLVSHRVKDGAVSLLLDNYKLRCCRAMFDEGLKGEPGSRAGECLIAPAREGIQELCLPEVSQSLRIVQGSLGSEANILGAVTLAL
jgi:hypothetical protein